jgi:UDPglucose 6-dehydrogenase
MLATKISFINEVANICERVGADVNNVRLGIGADQRIGYSFIYPGIGYGGTCFPKDIAALKKTSLDYGYEPTLITAVAHVNKEQKMFFVNKILNRFGENLSGFVFAVWGLSFKPETDDMRKAPSTYVIKELVKRGAKIQAYDPKAMGQAKSIYLEGVDTIAYGTSKYDVLDSADALLLLTEWKEFRSPDFNEIKKQLRFPVIFDGRNQYIKYNLIEKGIEYYRIGK